MKILRIHYKNAGIFEDDFEIDFVARDKVTNKEVVYNYHSSFYTQNTIALAGMNASGKTSALHLIKMAMDIVLKQTSLKNLDIPLGLIGEQTEMIVDFYTEIDNKYYRLESTFKKVDSIDDEAFPYGYATEKLYQKLGGQIKSKKMTTHFDDKDIISTRETLLGNVGFLRDDDSILFYNLKEVAEKNKRNYTSMINENNVNLYRVQGIASMEDIGVFDNSIESMNIDGSKLSVKFKNNESEINCMNVPDKNYLLSSGTSKGGNILFMLKRILRGGGYLIIDELENHFHKRLVELIIDLFNDEDINRLGATLIFTTHYAEVLDSIERKDNVFLFRRTSNYTAEVVRYSDIINRIENRKSEVFLSNYLGGTAPSYNAIQKFKESVWG